MTGIASGLTLPLFAGGSSLPPFPIEPTAGENAEAGPTSGQAGPVVLLVEDNWSDVHVIRRVLKQCGVPLQVVIASDGDQALAILQGYESRPERPQPSVILLDWNLPRVSGAEVLAYARQTEHWRNVPIVVVTSSESPGDLREMSRLGATSYFRKPIDLNAYMDLEKVVLDVLPKPSS